jgi:transcriptional regulator with XRE-family HTH domain
MKHEIAERLREERKRLGLSQEEMAKLGGVTARSQRNYESGARLPDAAYLAAIGVRDVDLQYVLSGIRYEAEMWAREYLLHAMCAALNIDHDFLQQTIKKAEDVEFSSLTPVIGEDFREKLTRFRALGDSLLSSAPGGAALALHGINQELLTDVLECIEQAGSVSRVAARKKAQIVAMIYLTSLATGKVDIGLVKSAIKLAE